MKGYFNTKRVSLDEAMKFINFSLDLAKTKASSLILYVEDKQEEKEVISRLDTFFAGLEKKKTDTGAVVYMKIPTELRELRYDNIEKRLPELPKDTVGIAFFKEGMDLYPPFDSDESIRYLRVMSYDFLKYYPKWVIIGVLAHDCPEVGTLIKVAKPDQALTVGLNDLA